VDITRNQECENMTESTQRYAFGWVHEFPDIRDYSPQHKSIAPLLEEMKMIPSAGNARSNEPVDLRQWCSPVEHQLNLGSCTANAGVGMIEYFERRAFGKHIDASRLFLYKTTRNLLHQTGDTGAFLRTTMGALVLFGVPPESYWPYTDKPGDDPDGFDREPPAFCYAFGSSFKPIQYYKLDPPASPSEQTLESVKMHLAAGFPSMFGFTVYSSIDQAEKTGEIPFPCQNEEIIGGHAVMAVGFDDTITITNSGCKLENKGALLIRNSWGTGWGDKGYGWLPYEYVTRGLAVDWWTLIQQSYVDTGVFGLK
jgi:C1A family cysteine protease